MGKSLRLNGVQLHPGQGPHQAATKPKKLFPNTEGSHRPSMFSPRDGHATPGGGITGGSAQASEPVAGHFIVGDPGEEGC